MSTALSATSLRDVRSQIETLAQDESQDAGGRAVSLKSVRDSLVGLLGAVDTYVAALEKRREADASTAQDTLDRLRENATLRERLIEEGEATALELDEAGILSHDELDCLAEEGLLHAAAERLSEFLWRPDVHPRGRAGKFVDSHRVPEFDPGDLEAILNDPGAQYGPSETVVQTRAKLRAIKPGDSGVVMGTPVTHGAYRPKDAEFTLGDGAYFSLNEMAGLLHQHVPMSMKLPKRTKVDPHAVKLSPEIAKIETADDAERYIHDTLGIEARLHATNAPTPPPPEFYRKITQALSDALDRSPGLKTGPHRLHLLTMRSQVRPTDDPRLDPDDAAADGAWAWTQIEKGFGDEGVSIVLNDSLERHPQAPRGAFAADNPSGLDGFLSPASKTVYGRLTHELGHAVGFATGFDDGSESGYERFLDTFAHARLNPVHIAQLGQYAASAPQEAWAEITATLDTPSAMDKLTPEWRNRLTAMRDYANATGFGRLL